MITGTLTKNTAPHEKWASRKPPRTGPRALLPPATAAHTPMARPRSLGSWKMLVSSERVAGMMHAAPMPMKARVKISSVALVARPDSTDPMPNTTTPTMRARLRPNRSPMLPRVSRRPANTSE